MITRDHRLDQPTFETLIRADEVNYSRLDQLVGAINDSGGGYHRLDFGGGLEVRGMYDMSKYVHRYALPANLEGKTVLDIGTASGYFALECARRGGKVTALELYDTPLPSLLPMLRVNIDFHKMSIYDLDESFGKFDLVICGSLLMHLPDIFGAVQKIIAVCCGKAAVSIFCTSDSEVNLQPICEFLGWKAEDADYYTYWRVTAAALRSMMLASGFSRVENEGHFALSSEPGFTKFVSPHVVMTGVR